MNPLPNRPLLSNTSLPLTLPNVPSFDQIAYNGRPRKVMPEAGKDYSIINGLNMVSGPSSAPAGPGVSLDRSNPIGSVILQQIPPLGTGQSQLQQQQQPHNPGHIPNPQQTDKDKEPETDRQQLTAIFRPDDAGEWREKLRLLHDTQDRVERLDAQARMDRLGSSLLNVAGASSWERRRDDDDEVKEEEPEVEEDDAGAVGEADTSKMWKPKRTLRKLVFCQSSWKSLHVLNTICFNSHLDAVRAVAFHPNELCLVTGGDDCTVKIWRMDAAGLASSAFVCDPYHVEFSLNVFSSARG